MAFNHHEMFESTHSKFMVSGRSKQQTNVDTHMCAQCSHACVGLIQARLNNTVLKIDMSESLCATN